MKNFLLPLLLTVAGVGETTDPVQLSVQNDSLIICVKPPSPGEKYTDCWLSSQGQEYQVQQLSPTTWSVSDYPKSGSVTVIVCSDDGGCHLLEHEYRLQVREPPMLPALGFALLAGLLMNFMPCVLPVIGLKLAAFAEASKRVPYIIGVMVSFMALATLSLWIGTGLSLMGFGHYRMTLSVVCFLFGLSLFHIWIIPSFGVSGNLGPFAMGILTVALGSSCAVPFLAPAMTFTMSCSVIETYLIFGALGVGFCGPFILPLSGLMKFFRHYLCFVEYACGVALVVTGVWLWSTLSPEIRSPTIMLTAGLLGILVMVTKLKSATPRNFWTVVTLLGFTLAATCGAVRIVGKGSLDGEEQLVPRLDVPQVTFVTADWCLTCGAMKVVMQDERVVNTIQELGIPTVTLDYTDRPTLVREFLDACYVRDVPTVRIVSIDGTVTVLSGAWTVRDVLAALNATMTPNVQAVPVESEH